MTSSCAAARFSGSASARLSTQRHNTTSTTAATAVTTTPTTGTVHLGSGGRIGPEADESTVDEDDTGSVTAVKAANDTSAFHSNGLHLPDLRGLDDADPRRTKLHTGSLDSPSQRWTKVRTYRWLGDVPLGAAG